MGLISIDPLEFLAFEIYMYLGSYDAGAKRKNVTYLSFSAKTDEPLSISSRRSLSTAFFRIITFSINSYKESELVKLDSPQVVQRIFSGTSS